MSIAGENYQMEAVLTSDVAQIDWERLALIFKRAPLGDRDPAILRQVFTNSGVRCFAWIDQALIGAGRAITDGVRYAAIFDVVVLPEYQNRGIGTRELWISCCIPFREKKDIFRSSDSER